MIGTKILGPSGFGVGAPYILWSHKHEESCKQFG